MRANEESLTTNEPAQVSKPGGIMAKQSQNEEREIPTMTNPFLRLWERIKGVLCLRTGSVDLNGDELAALDVIQKWDVAMRTSVQHESLQGLETVNTHMYYGNLANDVLGLPGVEPDELMIAIHKHSEWRVDIRRPFMMQSYLAYKYPAIVKDKMLAVWLEDGFTPERVSQILLAHYNKLYMSNETFDKAHNYASPYHEAMVQYIQMYQARLDYSKKDEEELLSKTEKIKYLTVQR
uniref:RxLR effector protein n=1 Tax=Peronospora matthiolae TaxID=2874970 RepID=A0AAV1UK04_9STRA